MAQQTTTRIALPAPRPFQSDNFALWTIQCPANRALRVDPRPTRRTTPKRSSRRDRSERRGTSPLEDGERRSFDATLDPYLELCFDQKRNSRHGIVLGTAQDCDVRIPEADDCGRPVKGVSRHHCAITFDRYNGLIIKDFSTNGTIVWYGKQGGQRRRNFTWVVSGHDLPQGSRIVFQIGTLLEFRLYVPDHDVRSLAYIENVRRFLTGPVQSGDNMRVGSLEIGSAADTAAGTGINTPAQGPVYITESLLGEGAFSQDVSTSLEYAGKVPLNSLQQGMLDDEARLIKTLTHDHIVPFKGFIYDPKPMMVLEYAPYGTLTNMMKDCVSKTQCVEIMVQALSALTHLHSFDKPVAHRDVKPDNILIKSKEPLHIWLADFGFSKASVELTTTCGTPLYKAAEVYQGAYTAAVDVWSLGVVALEIGYGLPTWIAGDAVGWSRSLARKVRYLPSDPLVELIRPMLSVDPNARPPASACFRASLRIRLPLEPPVAAAKSRPRATQNQSRRACRLTMPATSRGSSQSTPRPTQRPRQVSEEVNEEVSEPLAGGWNEDDLFGGNWLANSMVVGSAVAAMGKESEQWSSSNPTREASEVPQASSSHQPVPPRRSARLSQKQAVPVTSSEQRMG
ncbi:Serine/threonine-protein kinase RAD53, partial [Tolypocladium ophioglossoides CBS 100239]